MKLHHALWFGLFALLWAAGLLYLINHYHYGVM